MLAAFKNEGKSTRQGAIGTITIDKQAERKNVIIWLLQNLIYDETLWKM